MSLDKHTKRQLDDIVGAIDDRIQTAIDDREVENKRNIFSNNGRMPSLESSLKKEMKAMKDVINGQSLQHKFEVKASDMTTSSGTGTYVAQDFGGVRPTLRSYFDLANLFPQFVVSGGQVDFVTEASEDNQFDDINEGASATQSDVQYKEVSVSLRTMRSFMVLSEELLSGSNYNDNTSLINYIRERAVQQLISKQNNELINGTGNISSLNGNKVDCPTDGTLIFADSVDNAQNIDVLKAVVGQQQNSGFDVDLIIISPKEMYNLQFVKDSNNNYVQGGLEFVSPNQARMGNINIYSTEVLSADKGFAVDTSKFGLLCRKNFFDAKLSSEGKNALINNVAYLRLSSQVNMAVLNANANMRFDFSDVKSALETP